MARQKDKGGTFRLLGQGMERRRKKRRITITKKEQISELQKKYPAMCVCVGGVVLPVSLVGGRRVRFFK